MLGFILGVLTGLITYKLYIEAYSWYAWYSYKDNIDWSNDDK